MPKNRSRKTASNHHALSDTDEKESPLVKEETNKGE